LVDVGMTSEHRHARLQHGQPRDATWFGGFSQGESTYDADGVPVQVTSYAPYVEPGLPEPSAKPSEWFAETASGGPLEAWQTYYPGIKDFRPRGGANPPWREGPSTGGFRQVYKADQRVGTMFTKSRAKGAEWFDTAAGQYDAFGRARAPVKSVRKQNVLDVLNDWSLRSRNTTFQCADPGCAANSSLQIFDSSVEQHRDCKLSIAIHVTDFDDEYSREFVERLAVNGVTVSSKCDPMAKGCTRESEQQLHSCLNEFAIDHLVGEDGQMSIEGKISNMVDECPVDGNLLSGFAVVTCLVRPLDSPSLMAPTMLYREAEAAAERNSSFLLRCKEPGCTAETTVVLEQDQVMNKTCKLTVRVAQTDFDDGDRNATEEVEWVKVGNRTAKEHVKPGRNPCTEARQGNSSQDEPFVLVDGEDVSADAQDGKIVVSAKISDNVDECGRGEGFLLDGQVRVVCE